MRFFDEPAKGWIHLRSLLGAHRVYQLVGVMIHPDSALGATHFGGVCWHRSLQSPSLQGNMLTPVAQCFSHPDEFFQEFVRSP